MYYNPYETIGDASGRWLKVNFHAHAGVCIQGTCGELKMDEVARAYAIAEYDALAISNHNIYLSKCSTEGIALLDAIEYSTIPHMLLVGVNQMEDIPHQQAIDDTVAKGGFVILCHPNWIDKEYWRFERLEKTWGYTGIEILNAAVYRYNGSGLALDTWDHLLTAGRRVYGFGNDDFHHWCDIARAYNVIHAKSTGYEDIREAVLKGRFYVSTGVALERFSLESGYISVKAKFPKPSYVDTFTYDFIGGDGRLLYHTEGREASFPLTGSEPYLRVEVTGEQGAKMYLQPVTRTDVFDVV